MCHENENKIRAEIKITSEKDKKYSMSKAIPFILIINNYRISLKY